MKYIINEKQYKLLQEFMQDGFSFKKLDSIYFMCDKLRYCQKFLGNAIGSGTGRIVFDLTDDMVLKLSRSNNHTQNESECRNIEQLSKKCDIFPKVYGHADDYSWIVCERVVQFHPADCNIVLGIPFSTNYWNLKQYKDANVSNQTRYNYLSKDSKDYYSDLANYNDYSVQPVQQETEKLSSHCTLLGFISWACADITRKLYACKDAVDNSYYEEFENMYLGLMYNNPNPKNGKWFKDLYKYLKLIGGEEDLIADNFGLAMRNGQPTIVILDTGFDNLV